ncbi:MAG: hypothetical protein Q8N30_08780 [Methylococcales bacterium]|nr:hypothetical protein [Methylococcales bacterium]
MNIIQTLTEALSLFKKLLSDLSGKRSLVSLLVLAFAVSLGAGFILYIIDPNVHSLTDRCYLVGMGDDDSCGFW